MDNMTSITSLHGLKFTFVFGNLELGGAERQGLHLAEYLQKECGAKVRVVGLGPAPGRLSELCEERGIPWSGVDFHWGLRRRIPSLLRALRLLTQDKPDVLVSYTRVPNMVCALGWRRIGAKLCVWNQADEGLLMNRLPHYRFAVSRAHCFISNSTGGKEFLVRSYGLAPQEVHVIYNGICAGTPKLSREKWRAQLEAAAESLVVTMIANLSPYKDHPTLIRAWKEVVERGEFASPPLLVLGGRFDGEEKGLAQLAESLGIADLVRLPGKIDDVPGLLAASDLFAYSSKSEGIPNAVLEAMAAGIPVAGTDIPGIREAVGPEGAGYLVRVGESAELAEKILALAKDRELRASLGRSLKARIEEKFTLESMCRESARLICRHLEQSTKP